MKKENSCSTTCDQKTEQYIYRKIAESAEAYREKLEADPSLAHIELTDAMRADMQRRIAAIKAESAAQESAAASVGESAALHDATSEENAAKPESTAASAEDAASLAKSAAPSATVPAAGESTIPSAPENGALSEEDRHALEIGRKVLRVKKRGKVLRRVGVAAAVALGVFGISMTSSANRLWLLQLWDQMTGQEQVMKARNWEDAENYDADMQEIYAEILEKTGIHAVNFLYLPDEVIFDNYVVYEDLNIAQLFYQYGDTVMIIDMKKELQQTLSGLAIDGDIQEMIEVENDRYGTIEVSAVSAPDGETDYVAEFLHDGCQYTIYGVLPREEFLKMIKEIQIF